MSYADGKNNLNHISKILMINKTKINKLSKLLLKLKLIELY